MALCAKGPYNEWGYQPSLTEPCNSSIHYPPLADLYSMNLNELVDVVAAETELPAGQVRKVSLALLEKFAGLIDSQINFKSPVISLTAVTAPAKPASEGKPAQPERKYARMAIRTKKPATAAG